MSWGLPFSEGLGFGDLGVAVGGRGIHGWGRPGLGPGEQDRCVWARKATDGKARGKSPPKG